MAKTATFTLGFLLLVAVALCVVSQHATLNQVTGVHSSTDIYSALELAAFQPGQSPCVRLEIAYCPLATNHDIKSPRYGQPSPQGRAYCMLSDSMGLMGVFGLAKLPDVIYVTGYPMQLSQWQKNYTRDNCQGVDVTWLQRWLTPPGAPLTQ